MNKKMILKNFEDAIALNVYSFNTNPQLLRATMHLINSCIKSKLFYKDYIEDCKVEILNYIIINHEKIFSKIISNITLSLQKTNNKYQNISTAEQMYAQLKTIIHRRISNFFDKNLKFLLNELQFEEKTDKDGNVSSTLDDVCDQTDIESDFIKKEKLGELRKEMCCFIVKSLQKKEYFRLFHAFGLSRQKSFGYKLIKNNLSNKYTVVISDKVRSYFNVANQSHSLISGKERGDIVINGKFFADIFLTPMKNYLTSNEFASYYKEISTKFIKIEQLFIKSETWLRKTRKTAYHNNLSKETIFSHL